MFKMPEIPDCLEKRYRALDNLIEELSARKYANSSNASCSRRPENAGIRLMCDFWNILKDDPDCNLKKEVQQRMGLKVASTHSSFGPHQITCYMSDRIEKNAKNNSCCKSTDSQSQSGKPEQKSSTKGCCASSRNINSSNVGSDVLPLSKVLCSLKDAASFDKKCSDRITDLMAAQKRLQEQIQHLEHREKEGAKMLKQADCMWSCMEEAYKKKVAESLERQKNLLKGLKEAEADVAKWRKTKKELESQLDSVNKCQQEIIDTTHRKKNDIKVMKTEIEHMKKRIANGKKDADAASKSLSYRKQSSDKVISGINSEISKAQKILAEEKKHKAEKEKEGNGYIKEAREELQKICRVLLQKKLENEDAKAERDALLLEIEMLKQTCEQCQDKCKKKQVSVNDEILKIEKDIANFKVRCIRCHECVDTSDVRRFCTDCPKCTGERDCITEDGHCSFDPNNVCVCMSVKQKFMDNVFENMYTVLERQVKTRQGKCLAETVMQSLKKSRNGKIDEETRKILQDFILCVVKKNLNLTIIGGAVKTRCEMDPETYKQLSICLKQVKVTRPPKVDKGTISKKDPCTRWGGTSECNCPGGPKTCVCTKRAPPRPRDPAPCPEDPEDKAENDKKEKTICPHKQQSAPCGMECSMRGNDTLVGTEIAPWVPDPCKEKSCPFSKNMRAAQCVLGPERLSDLGIKKPIIPNLGSFDKTFQENSHDIDLEDHQRDRIIEEVLGRYSEVAPIEKVSIERELSKVNKTKRRKCKGEKHCNKRNINGKNSKDSPKIHTHQILAYAPKNIKINELYNFEVSPKMNTIYISQKYDFWQSDDTLFVDESSDDINLNISNEVEFALISNEAGNKICGHDLGSKKCEKSKNINVEDTIRNEDAGKIYKTEASTLTNMKIYNRIERKRDSIKSSIEFDKNKRPSEKDILLKNLYQRDAGIQNTENSLATMKLLIKNDDGDIINYCTELVNTPSGELGLEIDDNLIHLIEKKANDNPNSTVGVLVKNKEGYYTLDFNPINITSDDLKIKVKKTSKGSMSIILNKTFIEAIKSRGTKSNANSATLTDKSASIEVIKKTESLTPLNKIITSAFTQSKENDDAENNIIKRLKHFCTEGNSSVTLKIIGKNEQFKYVKAKVIRTPSKNIALEVKNYELIEENLNYKEDVGLLHLSYSDTFLLDFRQSKMNIPRNILIKKDSDNILLIIIDQLFKPSVNSKHEYFKIKVKGDNGEIINPPAVLKTTTSNNYVVIVDKEYDHKYKETMKRLAENNAVGSGVLSKTLSGEYIISLNKNDDEDKDCNAYILKSNSGNMKIVVTGPAYDKIRFSFSEGTPRGSISSTKLIEVVKQYHDNKTKIDQKQRKLPKNKSESDSTILDKSRIENQESFIVNSGSLRKTNSGRYSVILDKESKRTFVNSLGSYLKKNSNSLIPVKRTESGGISILMDNQENPKGQHGSLKISPSGNIYVILDDKINDLRTEHDSKTLRTISRNPSHKAVSTHCNANPLDSGCNVAKCVCEELLNTKSDWFLSDLDNDQESLKKQSHVSSCNLQSCPRKVGFDIKQAETCSNKSTPHIVIKPSDNCKRKSSKSKTAAKRPNSEQCFYVFDDSICPYHKDRYDTLSNDLIEISGFCNNFTDKSTEPVEIPESIETKSFATAKEESVMSQNFDYLDLMPPQLPPFLREFTIT